MVRLSVGLIALAAASSCTEPAADRDVVDLAWVSGEASAAIDAAGKFVLPQAQDALLAEIPETVAQDQAAAWLATFGGSRIDQLSAHRGESLKLGDLRICGRAFYSRRAYLELDTIHPLAVRRAYGPSWLTSFCDKRGVRVVSLDVSSYNTDVRIVDGKIRLATGGLTGGEFKSWGIPLNRPDLPATPESAVRTAYEVTRLKVTAVPALHMPGVPGSAYSSKWRVVLEHSIRVELVNGDTVTTPIIWIGDGTTSNTELSVETGTLPQVEAHYRILATDGSVVRDTTFVVKSRPERGGWTRIHRILPTP